MIDTHKKGDESFIMSAVNVFGDNWRRTINKQTKAAVLNAVKERFHAEMMFYDQTHQQTQSIESLSKQWNRDTSPTSLDWAEKNHADAYSLFQRIWLEVCRETETEFVIRRLSADLRHKALSYDGIRKRLADHWQLTQGFVMALWNIAMDEIGEYIHTAYDGAMDEAFAVSRKRLAAAKFVFFDQQYASAVNSIPLGRWRREPLCDLLDNPDMSCISFEQLQQVHHRMEAISIGYAYDLIHTDGMLFSGISETKSVTPLHVAKDSTVLNMPKGVEQKSAVKAPVCSSLAKHVVNRTNKHKANKWTKALVSLSPEQFAKLKAPIEGESVPFTLCVIDESLVTVEIVRCGVSVMVRLSTKMLCKHNKALFPKLF